MTTETIQSDATSKNLLEESEEEENLTDLDLTGRIIGENYRIRSKIGAGSFGQVYLCENLKTNDEWAMKIESRAKTNNSQLFIEVKQNLFFFSIVSIRNRIEISLRFTVFYEVLEDFLVLIFTEVKIMLIFSSSNS